VTPARAGEVNTAMAESTTPATRGPELEPYQIVLRPLITEKGTHQFNRYNAYPFEVHPLATKEQIKHAIEALFNVRVLQVRTQNRKGKPRRFRFQVSHQRGWKKAIVTLHDEDRIDFF
jgi:large subunit ribosomal protein L23